jgi:hypothetical protein
MKSNLTAIIIFLILNHTLFLVRYFLSRQNSSFVPYKEFFRDRKFRLAPLFSRFNDDVFRINIELTVLTITLLALKNLISFEVSFVIYSIVYLSTLILFYYHYAIYSIYKTYPSIYVDIPLIKEGFTISKSGFKTWLIVGLIGFLLAVFGILYLIKYFIQSIYNSGNNDLLWWFCIILIIATGIFCFIKKVNFFKFKDEKDFHYLTYATFQSTIFILNSNRFFNYTSRKDIENISGLLEDSIYSMPVDFLLHQKPNVYFIAIESYGAILRENEIYKSRYLDLCRDIKQNLNERGFQIASKMSKSPVTGGKSWVAYSSFLKGINIKSDFIYKYLFHNQSKHQSESIFDVFEKLGYTNYLISGLGGFENYTIEWEKILSFLGTKNVIKYNDLKYNGITFNFGPSAPDQYLLHKSTELIKQDCAGKPIASFVETINSHYPFESPTIVFEDWHKCNKVSDKEYKTTTSLSKNVIENYFLAIEYQLKCIEDLILKNDDEAIFVLFGDHQPPIISNHQNTYNTPVHIISKNKSFIQKWYNKGFCEGLYVDSLESDLCHFNLKNIFLNNFLENYGKSN